MTARKHQCGCAGPCENPTPRVRRRVPGRIEKATIKSIAAAHDKNALTDADEGSLETLLWLAGKMDRDEDTNPRLTANSYATLAAQLGLTVLGRERIAQATGVPSGIQIQKDGGKNDGNDRPAPGPAADPAADAANELAARRAARRGHAG